MCHYPRDIISIGKVFTRNSFKTPRLTKPKSRKPGPNPIEMD